MTWQRIDENTYIDNTLVTYAEYQLFIDEMREHGNYYQPDHWTSYQFPVGNAREPIFGVRHSDAVAFCEWLTNRENGEWNYRLPSQESVILSTTVPKLDPIGYWTTRTKEGHSFLWNNVVPVNPRAIDPQHILNLPLELKDAIAVTLSKSFELDLSRVRGYVGYYAPEIGELEHLRNDLFLEDINSVFLYPSNRSKFLPDAITFAIQLAHNRSNHNNEEAFHSSLNLVSDLVTLQERIAGRSPAFEGIRLVKERIR